MARAGSPGISRSSRNVTSVIPNSTMTRWARRRGSVPKRLTSAASVRAHRERLQGQLVVAQRGHVEPVDPVADAVPVGAVVDDHERRLLVDDLLDLAVHLLPRGVAALGARLIDQRRGLAVAPVAVERIGAALAVGAERGHLVGCDAVVGPVPLAHLRVTVVLLVVGGEQLV